MQNFELSLSTRVIFGRDTHRQVGQTLKGYGFQKVLFLYGGGSIHKTGLYQTITASLQEAGVPYIEKGGVQANPTVAFCRETAKLVEKEGVDCLLAVGGGSVIDTAKMAAHCVACHADPYDLITKSVPVTATMPVGVVLTIAAAGSETSDSAVLTDEATGLKRGLSTDFNRPLFAIMDPTLTFTLPAYQTACGVVDIMMHTLERYFCHNTDNALNDHMCEGLLRTVIDMGPIALKTPEDYEARAAIMWAGSLSHNGLTGAGRESRSMDAHQLEHELSARDPRIAHGAGLAVIWPAYLKYIAPHCTARMLQYAQRVWGVEMDYDHPERTVAAGIAATEAYFRSLGMPGTLRELGLGEDAIDEMAERCTNYGKRTLHSYVPLNKKEIMEIYRLCL